MNRTPGRHGVTLLEVMLALSLVTGLIGSLLAVYDQVLGTKQDIFSDIEKISTRRFIMERLTDELRGAMVYPFLNIGLEGEAQSVQFMTASVPGKAAWAVRGATDDPVPPEQDMGLVGYGVRIVEDEETGEMIVVGLERTYQKTISRVNVEGEQIESVLLTSDFKFIRFRFWDGVEWQESCGGGQMPVAVEMCIGEEALPEETEPAEYPYPVFRRVVYMPSGAATAEGDGAEGGAIIRGLGEGAGI